MMRVLTGLRRQSAWQPYSPLKFEFKKLFSKQQQIQTLGYQGGMVQGFVYLVVHLVFQS